MPTIRIDRDVYEWLQRQAKAFEDTPNSVLRKVAGLETATVSKPGRSTGGPRNKRKRTSSGRQLARQEALDVRKAYYHWEGTFFQSVHEFPVALFDRYGYLVIQTQSEYLRHPKIGGLEKTNIPSGIASFSGYKRMKHPAF